MTNLEERIRTNLHAAGARLPDAAGGVALRRQERPSRLRGPLVGVAALVAVLVILGVPFWLLGGDTTAGDPTAEPSDTTHGEQGSLELLFAPENALVVDVNVSATTPSQTDGGTAAGLVESPSGATYRLSVRPSTGDVWTSVDSRLVGDRTFLLDDDVDNAVTAYAHTDACATVVLLSSAEEPRWNDEALALLAGLGIVGRHVDVQLPDGWTDHGAGPYSSPLYQVSFEVAVDGITHLVALRQMPGGPVAALPALAAGPLTRTSVESGPAWVRQLPGRPLALVWEEGGVAVMLEADGLTAAELRDLAPTLRRDATSRWESVPVTEMPDATVPPGTPRIAPATCGPTLLTVS